MNRYFEKRLIWTLFLAFGFLILPRHCSAEVIQLFLDVSSEPVVGRPLEIEMLVLNENGEVESTYQGKQALNVIVEESGMRDESYYIRQKKVNFKKGKASFTIEDSEDETLDLEVRIGEGGLSGNMSISFLDKDIFPPEIVDIFEDEPGILKLEFNEELDEESAQDTKNYTAVTNRRETNPVKIEYHRTYVFLKFEENFLLDEEGYIELEGIKDLKGNEISSGHKSPDFEGTCADACPD